MLVAKLPGFRFNKILQDGSCSVESYERDDFRRHFPELSDEDIKIIDPDYRKMLSRIKATPQTILLKFHEVRCLITTQYALIPVQSGPEVVKELASRVYQEQELSFEFQVIEAILHYMQIQCERIIDSVLHDSQIPEYFQIMNRQRARHVPENIEETWQELLFIEFMIDNLSKTLSKLDERAPSEKHHFYLTQRQETREKSGTLDRTSISTHSSLSVDDVEEFNGLIATYSKVFTDYSDQIEQLKEICETANTIKNSKVMKEHTLLQAKTTSNLGHSISLQSVALIPAWFGMNLVSGWEQVDGLFWTMVVVSIVLLFLIIKLAGRLYHL